MKVFTDINQESLSRALLVIKGVINDDANIVFLLYKSCSLWKTLNGNEKPDLGFMTLIHKRWIEG